MMQSKSPCLLYSLCTSSTAAIRDHTLLMEVESTGIDPVALESALQRVTTSSTSEKGGGQAAAAIIIDLLSDHGSDIGDDEPAVQAVNLDGADAAHPIIIDTDEDTGGEQSEQSVANKDGTEVSQLPSRSGQIITGVACHLHAERSTHVANEAGPSQQRYSRDS